MSTNLSFEALANDQQELVRAAYNGGCAGCAVYIGETPAGAHTYFWHYGASEGYVTLPIDGEPEFDYESGSLFVGGREFRTDGQEVLPPPFGYLVHVDIRKWNAHYTEKLANGGFVSEQEEKDFLFACGGGSSLPKRAAEKVGKTSSESIPWAANFYIAPWELTKGVCDACVAITLVRSNGDKIALL